MHVSPQGLSAPPPPAAAQDMGCVLRLLVVSSGPVGSPAGHLFLSPVTNMVCLHSHRFTAR